MNGIDVIKSAILDAEAPAAETLEIAVRRLAMLSPVEYDRARVTEAERLGCRPTALDKEVKMLRTKGGYQEPILAPHEIEIIPWPEPVDGRELIERWLALFRKHLILDQGGVEVLALWTLFSHAHENFRISPILCISSPTPECGKTTCLSLIGMLVPKPLHSSNITQAALFRTIEQHRPTLLIDEADTFLRNEGGLIGILNSGHNRETAFITRTTGDDFVARSFGTFAAKAIALIGTLPPTLESRSISVELRRKKAGEHVQRLPTGRLPEAEYLRRQAARWASDNAAILSASDPILPPTLSNRTADNWRPLLSIADAVGGEWPERARKIAEGFSKEAKGETSGVELLRDLQIVFEGVANERLATIDIIGRLGDMDGRPWGDWDEGKAITATQIARLLKPFKIYPTTIRLPTRTTAKGYKREEFRDAFSRYLTKSPVTASHLNDFNQIGPKPGVTCASDVTAQNEPNMPTTKQSDVVTAQSVNEGTMPEMPDFLWRKKGTASLTHQTTGLEH